MNRGRTKTSRSSSTPCPVSSFALSSGKSAFSVTTELELELGPKHRGISPRALTHVFQEVNARIETAFSVTITYMEIYNEKIFDLLVDPAVNATKVREGIRLKVCFARVPSRAVLCFDCLGVQLCFSHQSCSAAIPDTRVVLHSTPVVCSGHSPARSSQ